MTGGYLVLPVLPFDWTDESLGGIVGRGVTVLAHAPCHDTWVGLVSLGVLETSWKGTSRPIILSLGTYWACLSWADMILEKSWVFSSCQWKCTVVVLQKWKEKQVHCPDSVSGTSSVSSQRPNNCSHFHQAGQNVSQLEEFSMVRDLAIQSPGGGLKVSTSLLLTHKAHKCKY